MELLSERRVGFFIRSETNSVSNKMYASNIYR